MIINAATAAQMKAIVIVFRVTTERTIWCDRCCHWLQESSRLKSQFLSRMKKRGWKEINGKTVCPDCVSDLNQCMEWSDISYRESAR